MSNTVDHQPKLAFSFREACAATSLSKSSLYNYARSGRLRVVRVGGRSLIPAEALQALIAGEVGAPDSGDTSA